MPDPRVIHGDALVELRRLPGSSVDAVITDPPYELGFMGKSWDAAGIAYSVELWAECLRVLKPGGHLAAFGGTRTYHRMACAVEDAGFEIRDSLQWIYGSGFPKSRRVSVDIDKVLGVSRERVPMQLGQGLPSGDSRLMADNPQGLTYTKASDEPATDAARTWQGWGTALKPAQQPIVLARKPLTGTVAANVLAHGVGGLNIDATRVGAADAQAGRTRHGGGSSVSVDFRVKPDVRPESPAGRWPANVLLTHSPECDGVCVAGCPVAELDTQSGPASYNPAGAFGIDKNDTGEVYGAGAGIPRNGRAVFGYGDKGGASRFFPTFRYQAKAPTSERPKVDGVAHPTVKPLALMRWLVRLLCPPGGLVLEPFAGSGTTVEACIDEGMSVIGIEQAAEYLPHIQVRVDRAHARQATPAAADQPMLFEELGA